MLSKLARGAPNPSQFVVSQFGSVLTTTKALTRAERASWGGTAPGPCAPATLRLRLSITCLRWATSWTRTCTTASGSPAIVDIVSTSWVSAPVAMMSSMGVEPLNFSSMKASSGRPSFSWSTLIV
jgi:hypothetical protein